MKEKMTKNYKGAASRRIFLSFPDLRRDLKSKHFWTPGGEKVKIDNDKSFQKIFNYILYNPVNKNLFPDQYLIHISEEFSAPQFIGGTENSCKRIISKPGINSELRNL